MKKALTVNNLITGKLLAIVEKLINHKIISQINSLNLKFVKQYSGKDGLTIMNVGLYSDIKNRKVVVKEYLYEYKNLFYWHIINEVNILNILSDKKIKVKEYNFSFPSLIKSLELHNSVILITELCKGDTLDRYTNDLQVKVLSSILIYLRKLTSLLSTQELSFIPKRTPVHILVSFPYYLIKAILQDIFNTKSYLLLALSFYRNYINLGYLISNHYFLTHRDLHGKNIIINGNDVKIIDPGILVMWEKNADLSILPIIYFKSIDPKILLDFVKKQLNNKLEKQRFAALNIYYTIQTLAVMPSKSKDYNEALEYKNNYLYKFIFPIS